MLGPLVVSVDLWRQFCCWSLWLFGIWCQFFKTCPNEKHIFWQKSLSAGSLNISAFLELFRVPGDALEKHVEIVKTELNYCWRLITGQQYFTYNYHSIKLNLVVDRWLLCVVSWNVTSKVKTWSIVCHILYSMLLRAGKDEQLWAIYVYIPPNWTHKSTLI